MARQLALTGACLRRAGSVDGAGIVPPGKVRSKEATSGPEDPVVFRVAVYGSCMTNRSTEARAAHARTRLSSDHNVWIATASTEGVPHLVPLSLAWLDESIVVATPSNTPTARNVVSTQRARVALDDANDGVLFDTDVESMSIDDAASSLVDDFVAAVGWDPRDNGGEWSLLILRPRRGQAWNGPGEIEGRTIVRDHTWLDT